MATTTATFSAPGTYVLRVYADDSVLTTAADVTIVANTNERYYQSYGNPNLRGNILLENDRLVVQKLVIPPGAREGNHTHVGNRLWIQMTPGEWTSHADLASVSRLDAGSVGWPSASDRAESHERSINAGSNAIDLLWVTLKPYTGSALETEAMRDYRLVYPEIPGTVLLDNDEVAVQRFVVQPGAWEGVHAHPGNQLYVHVKGGTWAVRTGGRETVSESKTSSVGWYRAIPLSQQHQSGNVGDSPIDLLWITLKR
ncbi:MAG: cupin domain-containing protein [Candidatus Rokubacteria bacterium]|nr:cupin domain-containing protein [Candidatus Rokubacteria bacterium]